jgi:hypothetical protein
MQASGEWEFGLQSIPEEVYGALEFNFFELIIGNCWRGGVSLLGIVGEVVFFRLLIVFGKSKYFRTIFFRHSCICSYGVRQCRRLKNRRDAGAWP